MRTSQLQIDAKVYEHDSLIPSIIIMNILNQLSPLHIVASQLMVWAYYQRIVKQCIAVFYSYAVYD